MPPNFFSKFVKPNSNTTYGSGDGSEPGNEDSPRSSRSRSRTRVRTSSNASSIFPHAQSQSLRDSLREKAPPLPSTGLISNTHTNTNTHITNANTNSNINLNTDAPRVVLTSENSDSPVQPLTPGSLHRPDSFSTYSVPNRGGASTGTNGTASARHSSDRSRSTPISTPRRVIHDLADMPHTTSPESDVSATAMMGLGIDLGAGQHVNGTPSAGGNNPTSSNYNSFGAGGEETLRHKTSSKSLNVHGQGQGNEDLFFTSQEYGQQSPARRGSVIVTAGTPTSSAAQGIQSSADSPRRVSILASSSSATSNGGPLIPDSGDPPPTASTTTSVASGAPPTIPSSLSASSSIQTQSSLTTPRLADPDTASITSSAPSSTYPASTGPGAASTAAPSSAGGKKMPWRRTSVGGSKKRKPTGLASAIAASGLAMANPGVAQPLAQFTPPPVPPTQTQVQPPRPPPKSPPRSAAVSTTAGRRSSNAERTTRSRSMSATGDDGISNGGYNGELYSDVSSESEDELDLNEDDIPVTGFAVASSKRNADFHEMFQSVPEGDYLIEDYGCALQREILVQGRIYISENHICFHANIFGWVTDLTIPVYEVLSLEKKMTALFIPNAIQITTYSTKYTFASFLSRDTTYDVLYNVWRLARPDADSIGSGAASARMSLEDTSTRMIENGDAASPQSNNILELPNGPPGNVNKVTQCACGKAGQHYSETAMVAVFPGTPEKIYNLMFASGFIKDFMRDDQQLKDIQLADWCPDPDSKLLSRNFSYIKPLSGGVGPKQTKCELKDETLHIDFDDYVSTLTTTRTPDVPSGSVFSVKTRTCIMWASSVSTKVIVTTEIEWTGRSFIKSIINSSAIDGQKQYHIALERAMRNYIAAHKTEFLPTGIDGAVVEEPLVDPVVPEKPELNAVSGQRLSEEEANKKREHERNQRATQWAFDTFMGAWKVAKQSTTDALDLVGDAWDQSSSTTILWFVIVVLVISNLWTLLMVGRREEVGRMKEMRKTDEQKKWVASIVAALWEERQATRHMVGEMFPSAVATHYENWGDEVVELNKALDTVEERVRRLRRSLQELD